MIRRLGRSLIVTFALFLASGLLWAEVTTLASPEGSSDTPGDIAVDEDGNVYSADFGGTTVVKIAPDGSVSEFLGDLNFPSGNAFDSNGHFFQANYGDPAIPEPADTITRRSANGNVSTWAKGLEGPVGIAVDDDDVLFVAMCDIDNVTRIPGRNQVEVFAVSPLFNCPNGITFDEGDNLYVVNFDDGEVLKILPNGDVSALATVPGNGNGHVTYVAGDLYVSSGLSHQIWKVDVSSAKVSLVAGSGTPGQVDGSNREAEFFEPNGLERNLEGSLLFSNGLDGVVRQISLNLPRPKRPRRLEAEVLSSSRVRLIWRHNSYNREGFSIHLAIGEGEFSKVAMVGPSEESVVINDLEAGTSYLLRVRAFNGTKKSRFSDQVEVVTP